MPVKSDTVFKDAHGSAYLDAMVLCYGALKTEDAHLVLHPFLNTNISQTKIAPLLCAYLRQCQYADYKDGIYYHRQIKNPATLYQAIKDRRQNQYKPLMKNIVSDLVSGYAPKFSFHHKRLIDFLNYDLNIDPIQSHLISLQMPLQFNFDWTLERIIESISAHHHFNDQAQKQRLKILLSLVYQHTPRWLDKGHTPHDLYIPKEDTKPEAPQAEHIFLKQNKIGRNAPCPCGSQQKYKKCCGKKTG